MKFTIDKKQLLGALTVAASAIQSKTTIPHLACVLIEELGDGSAELHATDQTISVGLSIEHKGEGKSGRVLVDARRLLALVRELGDEVTFASDDVDRLIVTSGRSKSTLRTLDPAEYPALPAQPDGERATIASTMLAKMIGQCAASMAADETRVNLCGMHFAIAKNRITTTATDGHRLASTWRVCAGDGKAAFILPRDGVMALAKALPSDATVSASYSDGVAHFAWPGCVITARTIEAEFPDVDQVIPESSKTTAIVDADALAAIVRRVSVLSNERTSGIELGINQGVITANAVNPDSGEAADATDADVGGPAVSVGCNARYLLDALAALDGDVVIGATSDVAPIKITSESDSAFVGIVMPCRL